MNLGDTFTIAGVYPHVPWWRRVLVRFGLMQPPPGSDKLAEFVVIGESGGFLTMARRLADYE